MVAAATRVVRQRRADTTYDDDTCSLSRRHHRHVIQKELFKSSATGSRSTKLERFTCCQNCAAARNGLACRSKWYEIGSAKPMGFLYLFSKYSSR